MKDFKTIYDGLNYVISSENGVITERYEGFKIDEIKNKAYVIFRGILDGGEEKDFYFKVKGFSIREFIAASGEYGEREREKRLQQLISKVNRSGLDPETCFNENYFDFVVLGITKGRFKKLCKRERSRVIN